MQLKQLFRPVGRRANVTVELALVCTFILLPLMAGTADYVSIITARAQLNTAVQALLYYAWTNNSLAISNVGTTSGGESTLIAAINNSNPTYHVIYTATSSSLYYTCTSGSGTSYTVSSPLAYLSTSTCPSGSPQKLIQYTITANVGLVFPLPLHANPYVVTVSGMGIV